MTTESSETRINYCAQCFVQRNKTIHQNKTWMKISRPLAATLWNRLTATLQKKNSIEHFEIRDCVNDLEKGRSRFSSSVKYECEILREAA